MATETELETLVVRLVGDVTGYMKALQQSQQATITTARALEATAKRIEGFTGGVRNFAQSAFTALAALGAAGVIRQSLRNFQEAEVIGIRLSAVLEANRRDVEKLTREYREFARQMEGTTTAEDDAILKLIQLAETLGTTGEKAKNAVRNAIGLGEAFDSSAESFIRMTAALEQGLVSPMLTRYFRSLAAIKDESKRLAEAQRLVSKTLYVAEAVAKSSSGQLKILRRDLGNLLEDFGAFVAEGIRPLVAWLKEAVFLVRNLDEKSKKLITSVTAVTAGAVLLGPAILILNLALSPLIALFGLAFSAVGLLLTPLGLLTAAIIAMGLGTLGWSKTGGAAIQWFTKQWASLSESVQPAIQGMQDALKAGDLVLAAQILWAQIKLEFAKGIASIKELWIGFVFTLKETWVDLGFSLRIIWQKATTNIAMGITDLRRMLKLISAERKAELDAIINSDLEHSLKEIEKSRAKALETAHDKGAKSIKAIQDQLKVLEKERDTLIGKAFTNLDPLYDDTGMEKAAGLAGVSSGEAFAAGFKKEADKVDATLFGSAESLGRITEFRDRLAAMRAGKSFGSGEPEGFAAADKRGAEGLDRVDKSLTVLKDIRAGIDRLVKKDQVVLEPAGLVG